MKVNHRCIVVLGINLFSAFWPKFGNCITTDKKRSNLFLEICLLLLYHPISPRTKRHNKCEVKPFLLFSSPKFQNWMAVNAWNRNSDDLSLREPCCMGPSREGWGGIIRWQPDQHSNWSSLTWSQSKRSRSCSFLAQTLDLKCCTCCFMWFCRSIYGDGIIGVGGWGDTSWRHWRCKKEHPHTQTWPLARTHLRVIDLL